MQRQRQVAKRKRKRSEIVIILGQVRAKLAQQSDTLSAREHTKALLLHAQADIPPLAPASDQHPAAATGRSIAAQQILILAVIEHQQTGSWLLPELAHAEHLVGGLQ